MLSMIAAGLRADSMLLLVPQRTLAQPYEAALRQPGLKAGGQVSILTLGGLARRMIDLFWPLVSAEAGFANPDSLPSFLTMETAQYYMAHVVRPLLEEGLFDSVTIERNRLYSQILDNLNKAAVVGFPHGEVGERLKSAWVGEPGQLRVYDDVQTCVDLFREYCLAHNLLDFSLQIEVFRRHLWPAGQCRDYLLMTYRHLIYDNVEEDSPLAHDLVAEWLPQFDSALLVYDRDAGYRRFLGADPQSAYGLKALCPENVAFEKSLVASPPMRALGGRLSGILGRLAGDHKPSRTAKPSKKRPAANPLDALEFTTHRYFPEMLDWVAERIASLVHSEGIPPGEIVVLAPFLSDALRFSLAERLRARQVLARSHRPSRSLREEPATRCLLTLAALANPQWEIRPTKFDVAYALLQAVQDMDLVRAHLMSEIVYREKRDSYGLSSFDLIRPETQERITYRIGERYEKLRLWLESAQAEQVEFDHFLSRLFGELLSQPGFGFHADYSAGEVTANLIESAQKFRWAAGDTLAREGVSLGKEYIAMVEDGVIAAQYIRSWRTGPSDAVLLAPAYTFLMSNRPVEVQFWLDAGSRSWSERLYQPLTHPYVLSRHWPEGRQWSDADEVEAGGDALYRLVLGLVHRCRRKVVLGLSDLGEQGYEQRGPLLQAFQRLLRDAGL
jgi:hypothetical protein